MNCHRVGTTPSFVRKFFCIFSFSQHTEANESSKNSKQFKKQQKLREKKTCARTKKGKEMLLFGCGIGVKHSHRQKKKKEEVSLQNGNI